MPRIRINRIPEGGAPEEVKQHWVGIELDAIGPTERGMGIFGKPHVVEIRTVYVVRTSEALSALKERNWMAAAYFYEHPQTGRVLYFASEDCIEVAPAPSA